MRIYEIKHTIADVVEYDTSHHQLSISGEILADAKQLSDYVPQSSTAVTIQLNECLIISSYILVIYILFLSLFV